MNKKILFIIFALLAILSAPAFASDGVDWGIFEDYIIRPNKYAFNKIFNNEPIRYYVLTETSKRANEQLEKNEDVDDLENLANSLEKTMKTEKMIHNFSKGIENAFNFWFEDTKNMIIKDGREEEFADIIPILSKKIKLRRVHKLENADIVFNFIYDIEKYCPQKASGCIRWKKQNKEGRNSYAYVRIPNPTNNKLNFSEEKVFHVLTHEIGHYFGLTDQHYRQNYDYKSDGNFHNPRFGYRKSTMGASYKPYLDCDDIDGFINLIDLTLYLKNKQENNAFQNEPNDKYWSKRTKNGWASFCNGKNEYFFNDYYRQAKVYKREVANWVKTPFNSYEDILAYDHEGKVLTVRDEENKYTFKYIRSNRDYRVSVSDKEKELTVCYHMDPVTSVITWENNIGNEPNLYFADNTVESCIISYATKIFNINNGECSVRDAKEKNSSQNKKDSYILKDDSGVKYIILGYRIPDEIESEKQILEEYICPLIEKECLFFKKIYDQDLKNNL